MSVSELRFPGEIPDDDLSVRRGGCQMGGARCVRPAEVEVQLPDIGSIRWLCREHVGYHMLGSTSDERVARVLVRRLSFSEAS